VVLLRTLDYPTEPVERLPYPPVVGGLTYAQGPHVAYFLVFLLFTKYFVKMFVHNEIYSSVVNYCLSNAIHGIGQSITVRTSTYRSR